MNSSGYIENIGDRNVRTLEKAGLKFLKMDISKQDGKEIRVYEMKL
jgi:hypothetical protein